MKPADPYLTCEEFAERFATYPAAELDRLNALGQRMVRQSVRRLRPGQIDPPLLDAVEALYIGDRRCPRDSDLGAVLYCVMKSIVSNDRKTARKHRKIENELRRENRNIEGQVVPVPVNPDALNTFDERAKSPHGDHVRGLRSNVWGDVG
jgi:hypothetical protein